MADRIPLDFALGALVALPTCFLLGPWGAVIMLIAAWLWAEGGQKGHSWRFIGIPAVLCLPTLWNTPFPHAWPLWSAIPIAICCTLGYGLPDPPSRPNPDAGSPLGRFWMSKAHGNEFLATIGARGTVVLGIWASMIPWFFIHKG